MHIYRLVQRCDEEHTKSSIQAITVGTLYVMRQGYKSVDADVTILPLDPYLAQHLPIMNQLPRFGIEKNSFTKGQRLIHFTLDKAFSTGIPVDEIVPCSFTLD